ncbi:MAG: tetratricopeptide repeat protein [Lutibacter sp.]|jgi:tetratricopeptide (TPR) repeat protein
MKINKKALQISILVLVVLLIGYYFFGRFFLSKIKERNNKPKIYSEEIINLSQDEIYEFKVVKQNLSEDAIKQYKKTFDKDKTILATTEDNFSLSILSNMAMIKRSLEDYEGARKIFEYINYKLPNNSIAYFNLANLYTENIKNYELAEENYLMAIKNSVGEAGNDQYYRGIANFYTYFYKEHIDRLENVLLDVLKDEAYNNNQDVLALLADYYGAVGKKNKAIEYWQKVLELDPNNQGVINEINKLK